jgi:hypothetical protein
LRSRRNAGVFIFYHFSDPLSGFKGSKTPVEVLGSPIIGPQRGCLDFKMKSEISKETLICAIKRKIQSYFSQNTVFKVFSL